MSIRDTFYLRHKVFPLDDTLNMRLKQNFEEIERVFKLLQTYHNKVGEINDKVIESVTDTDGNLLVSKLNDTLVGLEHELQLADQAVTDAKIAVGAIKTPHIADGAITNMKLAAEAVLDQKANWSTHRLY